MIAGSAFIHVIASSDHDFHIDFLHDAKPVTKYQSCQLYITPLSQDNDLTCLRNNEGRSENHISSNLVDWCYRIKRNWTKTT